MLDRELFLYKKDNKVYFSMKQQHVDQKHYTLLNPQSGSLSVFLSLCFGTETSQSGRKKGSMK